ncbi:MAG: SH3 domain-containing protein [Elainellaceae cyanobacterium]
MLRLLQGLLGACLAVGLLAGAGAIAARYFMTRLTALPPRPTFSEEAPPEETPVAPPPEQIDAAAQPDAGQPDQPAPEAPPADQPEVDLEENPNAYRARVVQPIGLILRQGPSVSTTQLGGIDYNEEVTILSESQDGEWVEVQLLGSEVVGWVKAGNTERVE